jgi:hypothetical protein
VTTQPKTQPLTQPSTYEIISVLSLFVTPNRTPEVMPSTIFFHHFLSRVVPHCFINNDNSVLTGTKQPTGIYPHHTSLRPGVICPILGFKFIHSEKFSGNKHIEQTNHVCITPLHFIYSYNETKKNPNI